MKHSQLLIILVCVLLAHVLFILAIKPSKKKAPDTQQPATETQAPEKETAAPAPQPTPVIPEPPKPETPKIAPFTQTYFRYAPQPLTGKAATLVNDCKGAIAVNLSTRTVLWSKNADTALPIASITKMMTALLAVEKMHNSNGAITLETRIPVTAAASKIGGRQAWIDPKESFTVEEMLKATMVHSANDCAYLLAEYFGGSEEAFVSEMNTRAQQLGCDTFHFYNSHGLPADKTHQNVASPKQLAYLAEQLLNIPEISKWSHVKTAYLRENDEAFLKKHQKATMLSSSNSLLGKCPGVNGMKTGYTQKAGFSIVATCERNGVKTAVVTLGAPSRKSRDALTAALLEWIYATQQSAKQP